MKIVALIPARSGSKRIPDKNIKPLGGVPLLQYSVAVARACPLIDEVYVSTDSAEYAKVAQCDIIPRPAELATDDADDLAVINHALQMVNADLVVYLRPTTPFRTESLITIAIQQFCELLDHPDAPTSLRSIEEMSESAYKCFIKFGPMLQGIGNQTVETAGKPNEFFIKTYKPNGYIDIVRPDHIRDTDTLWGDRVYGFDTPETIELDTPHEWDMAEMWLATKQGGHFEIFR